MKVNCPNCDIEYNIKDTIPGTKNGTLICTICQTAFNIIKVLNNNHTVSFIKVQFRNTDKDTYVDQKVGLLVNISPIKQSLFKKIISYIRGIFCI